MGSRTVEKAIEILGLFLEEPEIGVMEVARRLRMDKSTVSRLLSTLEAGALVTANPVTHRYRLGKRVLQLAAVLYQELDLRRVALPTMRRLRDVTGETVSLQTRVGDTRVCIEQVPSRHDVRRVVEIGQPLPLHAGSSGKVLLAFTPDQELESVLKRLRMDRFTPLSPDSIEALWREIDQVRSAGYAISIDERVMGVSGISAPIRNYRGEIVAALAISGPSARWTPGLMEASRKDLLAGAVEISASLGYEPELLPRSGDSQSDSAASGTEGRRGIQT